MSKEHILTYLQAIRRREEAKKRFTELTEVVNDVGKRMAEELKSVTPSNPRVVHRVDSFGMHGGFVDTRTWPSADTLLKTRQEMLSAVTDAQTLWDAILQEERHGLLPPNSTQVHG